MNIGGGLADWRRRWRHNGRRTRSRSIVQERNWRSRNDPHSRFGIHLIGGTLDTSTPALIRGGTSLIGPRLENHNTYTRSQPWPLVHGEGNSTYNVAARSKYRIRGGRNTPRP